MMMKTPQQRSFIQPTQSRQNQSQKSPHKHAKQQVSISENSSPTIQSPIDEKYYTNVIKIIKSDQSLLNNLAETQIIQCLTQSETTRVLRGMDIGSGKQIIVKIVLIYKRNLNIYRMILGQAEIYSQRLKHDVHDSILPDDKIKVTCNSNNTPSFKHESEQQVYLQLQRPYFFGRNFHEEVYVHSKFPFQSDQMADFIKYSIRMLVLDTHEPTFLPTLDNIYFDGISIIGNFTSFQTYMFLRGQRQHLSTQNFKQLYIMLPSDPKVFCEWEKMREYMLQNIKIKSFLIMLFCFCTIRSPIEMVFGDKVNEQDLQWPRLVDPKTQKIKEQNKIIKMIKDLPNKWRDYLNKPQNRKCLEKGSERIFYELKYKKYSQKEEAKTGNLLTYTDNEKNYLYNLFDLVFIKEKPIGLKDFFQTKNQFNSSSEEATNSQQPLYDTQYLNSFEPLRAFVISSAKDEQMMKKQHQASKMVQQLQKEQQLLKKETQQEYEAATESDVQSINGGSIIKQSNAKLPICKRDEWQWKRLVTKTGFLYLHKYFLALDIKKRKLTSEQASKFARSLHFQTYLPMKLSIPVMFTLDYQDWYEIFYEQMKDERPWIYEAAKYIQSLIKQKSIQIMKLVKGCQLSHLKRVQYIVVRKLKQMKLQSDELAQLQEEIKQFITDTKPFEYTLESGQIAIHNAQRLKQDSQTITTVKISTFQELKMYQGEQYDDIQLILSMFMKIRQIHMGIKSSIQWTEEEIAKSKRFFVKMDMLRGPAKFKRKIRTMIEAVLGQQKVLEK